MPGDNAKNKQVTEQFLPFSGEYANLGQANTTPAPERISDGHVENFIETRMDLASRPKLWPSIEFSPTPAPSKKK